MSAKKLVIQLEKHVLLKFPEYNAKCYSNRRNFYKRVGLDNSIFGFTNFKKLLEEVDLFLDKHLPSFFQIFQSSYIQLNENMIIY